METIVAFISRNPIATLLVAVGIVIRFWVNKRRFYRRSWGGHQHFHSYTKAVITLQLEKFLMLLSVLLFIVALIIFITD